MSDDPVKATLERAAAKADDPNNVAYFQMPLEHLVVWSQDAGQVGSATRSFLESLISARSALLIKESVDKITESQLEASRQAARVANKNLCAQWALVVLALVALLYRS